MRSLLTILVAVVVLFPLTTAAIEGPVFGIWPGPDTVDVTGEIWVPAGSTLVIDSSVVVIFQGHYKFRVDSAATLIAVGAPTDSIVFTPADTSTGWHGIRFYSASDSCRLSYCRIEYGKAEGSDSDERGGGIYCENSSPTITYNTIRNNTSAWDGGGISCFDNSNPIIAYNTIANNSAQYSAGIEAQRNSNLTIIGNVITGNYASHNGGGIHVINSSATITDNVILGNTASAHDGGGINFGGLGQSISIRRNTISGNSARDGGGIWCTECDSTTIISDNIITGNSAWRSGGGIYCVNSSPTIENNTIDTCSAGSGGGIHCENSSPTISGNTISNNLASDGAGILCDYSSPAISGNIISGNSACFGGNRIGGGINCGNNSNPHISNNTISGNSADYGGGISCNSSSPTVVNTILWGDTAPNGPEIYVFSGNPIVTYCDVQGGWEGEGNIDTLPLFRDPANSDFHLQSITNPDCGGPGDSPCIDAGDPDSLDAVLDCFHGLGTYTADMGAYGGGGKGILTLTIVPGDTVVAHRDTLCYHVICENRTPDYQSLSFKVNVRLPNGNMYGPIFGPARFGMFGNGISEGDMCHRVPPPAPTGGYWLFAEVYNFEYSAKDSMAFTITGSEALAGLELRFGEWQTVLARLGDEDLLGRGVEAGLPAQFALESNYPNPFNASTVISYQLPLDSRVKLEVYNLLGRKVATLVDGKQEAGYRSVVWDASEVSSGLYFYKLSAGDFTETRRMMLVK